VIKPVVSIICNTYNHELYIGQALEGFLAQSTAHPMEILVHDDASTDNTPDIIRDYEKRYPNLINPIYQKENQLSLGRKATLTNVRRAGGDFVAICEGDDYWTDPSKLSKQVEALRAKPQCDLSFHPAIVKYLDGSRPDEVRGSISPVPVVLNAREVIGRGGGFMPSMSVMYRRHVFDFLPRWLETEAPVTDRFLKILGSLRGGAVYLPDVMAVYRKAVPGSWTAKMASPVFAIEHHRGIIACLNEINSDTSLEYDEVIREQAARSALAIAKRCLESGRLKDFAHYARFGYRSARLSDEATQKLFFQFRHFPQLIKPYTVYRRAKSSLRRKIIRVGASKNALQ
jgi:glycosyltransferase involved in cell wall biosynthesis